MKRRLIHLTCLLLIAGGIGILITRCITPVNEEKKSVSIYGWLSGPGDSTDDEIQNQFTELKQKGFTGLMYNGGQDPKVYKRVGKIAKQLDLEFHTWIPTMVQAPKEGIDTTWYAINGHGESAYDKPAYVSYYKFLCPNRTEVIDYLSNMYSAVAEVEEVDAIHLDYIRFPDVILAPGLWDKYGLTMDKEYPQFDYCYCKKCVGDFKEQSGIDILSVEDPTLVKEWKQFRNDLITTIVNKLVEVVHEKGKKINAAVFPGPFSVAKKIVRQEWNKWNLDAVFPMNYNDFYLKGPEWVGEVTKEGVDAVNGKMPLVSGLFICPDPEKKTQEKDPENHGLLPEELGTAIHASIDNGAAGICLFTPNRMTDAHWIAFDEAMMKYNN